MLEIFLNALPYIATALTSFFGSTILMYRQNKHKAELENESFEGEEWKKLYEEQKERMAYWEQRAEERQVKLDEREDYWCKKLEEAEEEITKHRDEKITLRNQLMDEKVRAEKLDKMKCEVRGCANRKPPSDYMM